MEYGMLDEFIVIKVELSESRSKDNEFSILP